MENCPDALKAMEEGNCLFGTVDTWLIWVRGREGGGREREGQREKGKGREGGMGRRERGGKERGRERRGRTEEQRGTSAQNTTCTVCTVLMKAGACFSGSFIMYSDIVHVSMTTRT